MQYPGIDGFLGTRASLMLDVVFLAMFFVLPVMGFSIYIVRYRANYALHKKLQLALGGVLAVAVTLFEVDVRLNDWRPRALVSPFYSDQWTQGLVNWSLWIHLVFAISTALLWGFVIIQALRKIPSPPGPCGYSASHIRWAKLAALDMVFTTITGWGFYGLAFVAS